MSFLTKDETPCPYDSAEACVEASRCGENKRGGKQGLGG